MHGQYLKLMESLNEAELQENDQEFDSRKTSRKQVPALHGALVKKGLIPEGALVLDYGGGAFDLGKNHIEENVEGASCLVYDKFNREETHNEKVLNAVKSAGGAEVVLCANVLNVIKEKSIRIEEVIKNVKKLVRDGGVAYFSIYNASKSDKYEETEEYVGQPTKDGWQNAQPTKYYLPEVQQVFPNATLKGGIIIAKV
jgi:hypothetical protein